MSSPAERLPWDSQFFGMTIGRWNGPIASEEDRERLRTWAADDAVACTYCLVDASDDRSARQLEALGARLVDMRMTYTLDLARAELGSAGGARVRSAGPEDVAALAELAAEAHTDSRFFFDGRFDRARVADLYREWIAKSVEGTLADGTVTFDHEGVAAGYVTFSTEARTRTGGLGEIGLVAVARGARGTGAGTGLLQGALRSLRDRGSEAVRVVTQARNVAAQRLYQRAGFTIVKAEAWYHLWSPLR